MVLNTFILYTAESRILHTKHGNPITFFIRYFHMILFFVKQSHGQVNNHPCSLKQEKNCIRMKTCCTVFLAIAIMITLLSNRYAAQKLAYCGGKF